MCTFLGSYQFNRITDCAFGLNRLIQKRSARGPTFLRFKSGRLWTKWRELSMFIRSSKGCAWMTPEQVCLPARGSDRNSRGVILRHFESHWRWWCRVEDSHFLSRTLDQFSPEYSSEQLRACSSEATLKTASRAIHKSTDWILPHSWYNIVERALQTQMATHFLGCKGRQAPTTKLQRKKKSPYLLSPQLPPLRQNLWKNRLRNQSCAIQLRSTGSHESLDQIATSTVGFSNQRTRYGWGHYLKLDV